MDLAADPVRRRVAVVGLHPADHFGQPWGDNPAPDWMMILFWLLFGMRHARLFVYLRLIVTVTGAAVTIHFRPLMRRSIPMADIPHRSKPRPIHRCAHTAAGASAA